MGLDRTVPNRVHGFAVCHSLIESQGRVLKSVFRTHPNRAIQSSQKIHRGQNAYPTYDAGTEVWYLPEFTQPHWPAQSTPQRRRTVCMQIGYRVPGTTERSIACVYVALASSVDTRGRVGSELAH